MKTETKVRYANSTEELDILEPLWNALHEHHSEVVPALGGQARPRPLSDAWNHRRAKYEQWLNDPESFFVVAEDGRTPVGYAFVTVGPGYSSWTTGRLAELETISVLPERRGTAIGSQLLDAVWSTLTERGVDEMVIRTALSNISSHRFYERHGFHQGFVVYYGKRDVAPEQR